MIKHLFRRHGHTFAAHDRWEHVDLSEEDRYAEYFALADNQGGRYLCQQMALELVAAIREGRPHVASGNDGIIALELLMATYLSHRANAPVTLPLSERHHPLELWQKEAIA